MQVSCPQQTVFGAGSGCCKGRESREGEDVRPVNQVLAQSLPLSVYMESLGHPVMFWTVLSSECALQTPMLKPALKVMGLGVVVLGR